MRQMVLVTCTTLAISGWASSSSLKAEAYHVAPVPIGSDENDCERAPCATFQRAVDRCPNGQHCQVVVAPGVYSQKTNVIYFKTINIVGPTDNKGNCKDSSAVVVDDRINGRGQRGPIFWVQDHATLTVSCMTLTAYASGSVGFSARQFAIGDVNDVSFGQFPAGYGIAANETSKINVENPQIQGSSSRFVWAADLSQVSIQGKIKIADGVAFEVAFLSSLNGSIVSFYPSSIVGDQTAGASYQCIDSIIRKNGMLPGRDTPYVSNENCKVSGIADPSSVEGIRTELNDLRSQLRRSKRERNWIIAVLALLVLASGGSIAYSWERMRASKRR